MSREIYGVTVGTPLNPNITEEKIPTKTSDLINDSFVESPTTAEVGQMLVVKAVDENGVPTEWEVSDVASGGSSEKWEIINHVTTIEEVSNITITTDKDGNPFNVKKARIVAIIRPTVTNTANGNTQIYLNNLYVTYMGDVVYKDSSTPTRVEVEYDSGKRSIKKLNGFFYATSIDSYPNSIIKYPYFLEVGDVRIEFQNISNVRIQTDRVYGVGTQLIIFGVKA